MKKSVLLLSVGLLSSGVSFGKVALRYQDQWDGLTSNGVAQVSAADVNSHYGSQEILDICLANRWDAAPIAAALKGRKFSANLIGLLSSLPVAERMEFAKTVADAHGKTEGIEILMTVTADRRDPAAVAYVLAVKDTSVTNRSNRALNLLAYSLHKTLAENKVTSWKELPLPALVDFLLLGGVEKHVSSVNLAKNQIKNLAVPLAKRSLRDKGKSFVTKDGVNPLEAEMKPVVDALNAPKLQGLEAALRGIGADIADIPRPPSVWDPVAAEKNAVFYGDKAAHPVSDGGIILLLGPDGYNAWVKEFNEGK